MRGDYTYRYHGERISGGRRARGASAPSQSAAAPLDARATCTCKQLLTTSQFITELYILSSIFLSERDYTMSVCMYLVCPWFLLVIYLGFLMLDV